MVDNGNEKDIDIKKEIEIVSFGQFKDEGYCVKVFTVRIFGGLRKEEVDSFEWCDQNCFETREAWDKYRATKGEARMRFRKLLREMLGLNGSDSFVEQKVVSEIFAVVAMYKEK